jgi:predicted nucleic acid-binding protein
VRLVIADTGPINYLLLIGHIEILPALFEKIVLPEAVRQELDDPEAPLAIRNWIAEPPAWVEVRSLRSYFVDPNLRRLDAGEEAAILLAVELNADLLLIDDRAGVAAARRRGFRVAGTLGVLAMAARRGLILLPEALARLKQTNFHYRQELLDRLTEEEGGQ